ncbi:SWIM zinc finger family protein [Streptomyces olivochromogenes]|uniref:SWIM zinc finger family protein n=1 Tax=Streptomyces olivochromogenes TaxID=1963 RepID=UPI001F3254A5|nr:SWIM zinc finger family protein [Streptomyces olivochromogenes]
MQALPVPGTERYEVELTLDGPGGVTGECDCPYGLEGNFCKHLVALGLKVLAERESLPRQRKAARERAQDLDGWLSALSKDELLALLREQIDEDRQLRRRLELRAASVRGDLAAVRVRIRGLLDVGPFAQYGYVEYADARAYADQAGQAVSAIRALTGSGRAADAITLAREAMRLLAEAAESVDDSDGWLGQIGADLADAHLDACRAARPDPEQLARWLVGHALGDIDDGLTDIDPLDYEDVLGEEGIAVLWKSAVEAWRGNRRGWAEKYLMERLAKAGGDVDAVIAVHAADLSPNGHTHLVIARELDTARRPDEALRWAERGIQETRDLAAVDTALVDYLCERYTQADRLSDAVAVRGDHFRARRSLTAYQQLRAAARAADCWPAERGEALALLRADAERRQEGRNGDPVLVDALLDDKDVDAAWQAATQTGGHDRQWLALADQARPARPADALGVYLRLAEPLTKQTGNAIYERLVSLLLSIRDCHRCLETEDEFAVYVTALRTAQKRKRNLMRLMDEQGL